MCQKELNVFMMTTYLPLLIKETEKENQMEFHLVFLCAFGYFVTDQGIMLSIISSMASSALTTIFLPFLATF